MSATRRRVVRLEFTSSIDIVEMVDVVSESVGRIDGLDEEARQAIALALRETVINAIKHGNRNDASKRVFVEFETVTGGDTKELTICVRDEGEGFDPELVPDPCDPQNLLKTSGRGILIVRSFMDDVFIQRVPEGGMEVRMRKRLPC
jgi:serine/threonine-protein kinase RsbW